MVLEARGIESFTVATAMLHVVAAILRTLRDPRTLFTAAINTIDE